MKFKNPNRGIFETVVLLFVFVAVFAFMVNSYIMERRVYREKALLYELSLLRQGVGGFTMMEKRKPANLIELATSSYRLPGDASARRFVDRVIVNDKGEIIDPFGHPFAYNGKKGWVFSTTPGYDQW
jgi:hypothetical protein